MKKEKHICMDRRIMLHTHSHNPKRVLCSAKKLIMQRVVRCISMFDELFVRRAREIARDDISFAFYARFMLPIVPCEARDIPPAEQIAILHCTVIC